MVLLNVTDGTKAVSLYVDNDNGLSIETLKSAYPNATNLINPNYGTRTVLLSIHNGKIYNPDGWDSNAIYSIYIGSRAPKPGNSDQSSASTYVPIETNAIVNQLEKHLFYEKGDFKACFTSISSHHAVSFNHGSHHNWVSNASEIQTVIICNQEGREFLTRVVDCNADVDYVVVYSEVPLVPESPTISFPKKFERYILLGYPNVNSTYEALEGAFSSVTLDNKGRMRGSRGSQEGYSGGPIFNYKGELLGINVANESSTKFSGMSGQSTIDELFNELNAAFPSLSVIIPVYYFAKYLNFQK